MPRRRERDGKRGLQRAAGPAGERPELSDDEPKWGEVVTLPPVHLIRHVLPGYEFPPPYTTYDVTMPCTDHREMVDPTWEAHPEGEV